MRTIKMLIFISLVAMIAILVLFVVLNGADSYQAFTDYQISFNPYNVKANYQKILLFDFDGDSLDDIMMIDNHDLLFFFQDLSLGFMENPDLVYSLDSKPYIIWPTEFGHGVGKTVLLMNNLGIFSLVCINKTTTPHFRQIITCNTLIPEEIPTPCNLVYPLTVSTLGNFPLIMLPTNKGLEVWRRQRAGNWCVQNMLDGALQVTMSGPQGTNVYSQTVNFNWSVNDINGDGYDDVVACSEATGTERIFRIFLQTEDETLPEAPTQIMDCETNVQPWFCFLDINRDNLVDLIKGTRVDTMVLVPGASSKVLIQIYLSDPNGHTPTKPQYVFRKGDRMSSVPVVDIDGDGYTDLVLGYSPLKVREYITKMITTQELEYRLRFHFYTGQMFLHDPDFEVQLTISIDKRLPSGRELESIFNTLITFDGDFNGDGCRDLLVKDSDTIASVYLFESRKQGFSKKASQHFEVQEMKQFMVDDLNKDGVSDVLIISADESEFTVYLSRRE